MQFTTLAIPRRAVSALSIVGLAFAMAGGRAEAIVFTGSPDLALTSAVVAAGGGPHHFSSAKFFAALTGPRRSAEAKKLTDQFGARDVSDMFAILDFAIPDVVGIATAKHIALPPPAPDPSDAKALALGLYRAGITANGTWDVGYMVERLISHPLHHVLMHDIDAKFGPEKNAQFHIMLAQMMDDLAVAYRTAER